LLFIYISVSRLADGGWSAPVAVGCFGMSIGLQIGASLADVMIVFMKPSALRPFAYEESTDIHLGPESGIVMGPVGRRAGVSQGLLALDSPNTSDGQSLLVPSMEDLQKESMDDHVARSRENGEIIAARMSAIKPAYTYSHCKGLFVGVSLDGSALTVRIRT
jgi:lipid-binding SYLF domain-containing protein